MQTHAIKRRQALRLLGAGILFGGIAGTATANEGHYIVGTSSRAATQTASAEARSVYRVLEFGSIGQAVAGTFSLEALERLARRPDIRYIEIDGFMHAIDAASDLDATDAEVPWGIDRVDAEKVQASNTGVGAHLAIIDTGIDNDHPDLVANLGAGISFTVGGPFSSRTSTDPKEWDDGNGHGTHCAGIGAAVDDGTGVVGVAPAATLHAVKVLDNSGSGTWSDVADGIRYVADQGWDIGSLSLGGGYSQTVEDACQYAYGAGVLLVAAAGNDGPGTADDHYPSASTAVVAVGATELLSDDAGTNHDSIAYYSSTGDTLELGAPGSDIYSTYKGGGHKTLSGTSMACPHVSGAGALLMATGYTNTDARSHLGASAEWPVYDYETGSDMTAQEIGNGLLDVEAAVGGTASDSNPAVTTDPPSDVTATSATLNGTLTDLGGAESADIGFEYREAGTETWTVVTAGTLTATGSFGAALSGLTDGATYEYRAVVTASDGDTATGSTVSFTTTDDPVVVSTGSASSVGDTGATMAGSLDDLGGAGSADTGFEYRPVGATDWSLTQLQSVSTTGGYSQDVTGLASGTDYEFRAVATASDGDAAAGTLVTFTTTGEASATPPSVSFTATEAGSPNPHAEVTVGWAVTDADGDLTQIVLDVTAADGSPTDSHTYTYTGSSGDNGSDYFKFTHAGGQDYVVTVTATDAAGNVTTPASQTVSS